MNLVPFTTINRRYFGRGKGPSADDWKRAIEAGEIGGKVLIGRVWVDEDEFNSKDFFTAANECGPSEDIDLLA